MAGGATDTILPQPDQRIPLTEFRGGARMLYRKGKPPVELSEENKWGDAITEAASTVVSNELKRPPPPPPSKKYKGPLVFEKGELVEGEIHNNSSESPDPSKIPSTEITKGSEKSAETPKKYPKTDIITRKLSNGIVVRLMPEDDSLKGDIQSFKFTGDEQLLFDKTLHFNHPVIKKYLQREDIKDKFYDFWKLYTTYDGTDQYTLMTYEEGKQIQRFKREVLEEYRKYLLNAALAFLLKQDKPELLEFMRKPEEEEKYSLMETILVPKPKEEAPAEEPPVEPVPPTEPPVPEAVVAPVESKEGEEEEEEEEEEVPDANAERKERIKDILEKINVHLGVAISKSPRLKLLSMNRDIVNIIAILDAAIHDYKDYKNNYQDGADITAMSIHGGVTKIKFPLDQFLSKKVDETSSLTEFLRKLVKIDVDPLTKLTKDVFYEFFSRKILHTEDAIEKLREYVKPKK